MLRQLLARLFVLGVMGVPSIAGAADLKLDFFHPTQLIPGGQRVITIDISPKVKLESVEVDPPEGVAVTNMRQVDATKRGSCRWEITLRVEPETPPGERSVVLVTSRGRMKPVTVTIPPHVPRLSKVEALKVQMSPVKIELTVLVDDASDDLGESPRLTSLLRCEGSVIMYLGNAERVTTVGDHQYRVDFTISEPNSRATGEAACKIEVKIKDEAGYEGEIEAAVLLKEG